MMCCPECQSDLKIYKEYKIYEDRLESGLLKCELDTCSIEYPIVNYAPRFVKHGKYAQSFGDQWKEFTLTQIDNTQLTETASHGGISLLFGFVVLWFSIIRTGLINYNKDNLELAVFLTMVGIFSIASMLATGIFLEWNLELIAALLALSSYKITHLSNA